MIPIIYHISLMVFFFCILILKGLVAETIVAFRFIFSGVKINDVSYSHETNSDSIPGMAFETQVEIFQHQTICACADNICSSFVLDGKFISRLTNM